MNIVRIGKSVKLLLYENLDLVNIAALVGFEDQSYFTKVFKRVTGVSPHSFRKSGGRIPSENILARWQKQSRSPFFNPQGMTEENGGKRAS
jgi:AraC-like DNA-binding protein